MRKRNDGLNELTDLLDDIVWVESNIERMGFLSRKKFKKIYRCLLDSLNDDYLGLIFEYQHEFTNTAYENTLSYRKTPTKNSFLNTLIERYL